jgi:HEAT repeat protein
MQKQETPLHKAKQALWAKLPSFLTSRFPQLQPRPAAIIRQEAVECLGALHAPTKEGILAVSKALKDPDMWVQIAATRCLSRFGSSATIALPELIKQFQSATTNQQVILNVCVEALVNIAPDSEAVAMAFLNAITKDIPPPDPPSGDEHGDQMYQSLRNQQVMTSYAAVVQGLGQIGAKHPKVVAELIKQLDHPLSIYCAATMYTLGQIGAPAKDAVPALMNFLGDQDQSLRLHSIHTLKSLGPAATAAIPVLTELALDPKNPARYEAAIALWNISGQSYPSTLVLREGLESNDPGIREQVARFATHMGYAAKELIPDITKSLKDESFRVRVQAVEFLAALAPQAPEVEAGLKLALEDEKNVVRIIATNALKKMEAQSVLLEAK